MRIHWLVPLLVLSGCIGNNTLWTTGISEKNVTNLSQIAMGMDKQQVLQIMRQPYSVQKFVVEDVRYDVWFYVTRPTVLGQTRMVPQNLTPLTFKEGVLVGWGFDYYNYLKNEKYKAAKPKAAPKTNKKEKEENLELERALKTPAPSKTTMSKPPEQTSQEEEPTTPPAKKEKPLLDKEDEKVLEDESEENFDFW